MADVFDFYVYDNRSIVHTSPEPIMQEDKDVAVWRFRIPKVLNNIDMSAWAWWFVYVNAKGQKFSELLTLTNDIDDPENYCTADYSIGYGISKTPGGFTFALEAINTSQGGEISGEWHTRTYTHTVTPTLQGNQAEYAETESDVISALMQEVRNKVDQLVGGATPLPVNLKSLMTDHDKVYLYTGSEPNESTGYWYYWNGTDFVPGGQYASGIVIDSTLSQSGQAADADVVGKKFADTDNLLNLWSYTKSGLTLKATSKSSFTINGTATGGVFANDPTGADKTANKFALEAGEYTFILEQENGDAVPSTMYWCFGTTPTSAVKNISNKQTITFPDTVYVYLRLANSGDTYTDLNIVASITQGKKQRYIPKSTAIDTEARKLVSDFVLSPVPFEMYPDDTKTNATGYVTDFVYPSGYVKTIKTKMNDTGNITLLLVSSTNKTVLRKYATSGVGVLTIDVYEYISEPFYIVTYGENASFFRTTYATNYLNFTYSFSSNLKTAGEGDVIAFEFSEKTASTNVVSIAQQVVYGNLKESSDNNGKTRIIRKMLVAGDSITAGYPNYTEGAQWWEAVARAYGLTATLAAQTGSGFSYYNGTNACKIAHNTDFSAYDIAMFAFGTNDYGNNIPIGTIDDEYTYSENSSQTFCACIKYVIDKIKTDNPKCAVVLSMPINRVRMSNQSSPAGTRETKWAYGFANSQGHTLDDYCNAIKAVCDKYCIPYIDHRNGAFDVYAVESTSILADGLHPSEYGYKLLGAEMTARFGAIIQPYIT